jgi:hypothetical protein
MRLIFAAMSIIGVTIASAQAPGSKPPVVVELFTSQGCSSCPPADAFIEELGKRSDLVVLTRSVTYWDRLGWKDSLGRAANTDLQNAYARRGGEGAGVYTPQTMVQGQLGAVGSDKTKIFDHVRRAKATQSAAIVVKGKVAGISGTGGPAQLALVTFKPEVVVRIGSGENGGRTIRYTNVVVSEQMVGRWSGTTETFDLPSKAPAPGLKQALILQKEGAGAILAGTYL